MKYNITKGLVAGLTVFIVLSNGAQAVWADYAGEQPSNRTFLVNKTVLDPRNNQFVDNLSIDQYKFLPDQDVWYRIEYKNITGNQIDNVIGKDILPAGMQFVSGDGVYDPGTNTVTVTVDHIAPYSSRYWDIKARFVSGKGGLPVDTGCVNNYAEGRRDSEMMADYASVCVSNKVLGEVSELPRTGPEIGLILAGSLMMALFGGYLMLRRRSA